ncbi:MAG: large-conductance mechanosensitive channel protein MscL [Planctomycetota bacterium]|nr:MAG: large-conductance mechanosensitive channel protein MscL [Planctomycetota bacterium]
MGFAQEFKEFAVKGNVVDLAVGIIIGGAFGKIVSSLVGDIVMPLVGLVMGGMNFTQLFIPLDGKDYENLKAAVEAKAPVLTYGNFIQTVIDFLVIAFVIFWMVKAVNKARANPTAAPAK